MERYRMENKNTYIFYYSCCQNTNNVFNSCRCYKKKYKCLFFSPLFLAVTILTEEEPNGPFYPPTSDWGLNYTFKFWNAILFLQDTFLFWRNFILATSIICKSVTQSHQITANMIPMLMAVSCLSPVSIQIFMSAFMRVSMVSGTLSCSLSSIAVAPSSWRFCEHKIFSIRRGFLFKFSFNILNFFCLTFHIYDLINVL